MPPAASPASPAPRHATGAVRSIWASVLRTALIAITVAVVACGSLAGFAVWQLSREIGHRAVPLSPTESVPPISALDGSFDVLLVGADNAAGQHGFGASRDAALNDVDIVVHVAADHRSGTVVSLPRDLVIPHPQCTDARTGRVYAAMAARPLNEAFSRGGLGCVVTTVESLTGIRIPYAALFSFAGTVKMADAVGGVPVCVTKAIDDPKSGLKLKQGVSVISGRTALAYLRDRHGVGDGSDLARIQSQQAYMSALLRRMTASSTLSDPGRLYSLASAAAHNVTLSESLADTNTMVRMAVALKSLRLDRLVFVQYPTLPDPADRAKVVPNRPLAATLVRRVQQDRPVVLDEDALGSGTVAALGRTPSPHPTSTAPPKRKSGTIPGLRGRTAAQQTCSVARP